MKILLFAKQFLRSPQICTHGTCHACHTLDTTLRLKWVGGGLHTLYSNLIISYKHLSRKMFSS